MGANCYVCRSYRGETGRVKSKREQLFSLLRYSNFRILEPEISCHYQVPEHKIKKCIFLNNLRMKHSMVMNFGQFMRYHKRKNLSKNSMELYGLETSSRFFFILKESSVKRHLKKFTCRIWYILIVLLLCTQHDQAVLIISFSGRYFA